MSIECVEAREQAQTRAEIARAGADLERGVRGIDAQRLQDASLNLGREHAIDRSRSEAPHRRMRGRDSSAARRLRAAPRERVEHARIENFPRANLLIDHLLTSGQTYP